jgi:hypothetical protein
VDLGSSAAPLSPAGSLDDLAARAGVTFPHLDEARDLAARRIADTSGELATATPDDVSVVMYGSCRASTVDGHAGTVWGRSVLCFWGSEYG